MYEYESNKADQDKVAEIVAQGNEVQPVPREMLEARIQELISEVERLSEKNNNLSEAWRKLRENIDTAERQFKEVLEGDVEAADIIEAYSDAFTTLGWEFNNEVEIQITVTWRGTIEIPFGKSVDDLDIDDFGIDDPSHNEYSTWFYGMDDYSIEER